MNKKLLVSVLFMVMTMQGAWALSGNGTAESPWLIGSVANWQEFCNSVETKTYKGEYVKLTANIGDAENPAVTKDYMVAKTYKGSPDNEDKYFMGTFDGGGFTLYVNIDGFYKDTAAPFRYLNGATIKNLKTACTTNGSIMTNGYKWRAGIAGVIYGTCTFENCTSAVTINSYDRSVCKSWGGLVAYAKGNVTFSNCVFRGKLFALNYPARQIKWDGGGFVGQKDDAVTVEFKKCLVYEPTVSESVDTEGCYTFIKPSGGNVTFTNAYTTMYIGTEQGTLASDTQNVPPAGAGIYKQTAVNEQQCYVFAKVTGISRYYPRNGNMHKPEPTNVTWEGTQLTKDTHYTISYSAEDDKAAGDYTVTLAAKDGSGYSGSAAIPYTVREEGDAIELDNASTSNNTTKITNNNGKTVNVTLTGRTFFVDGKWNTVCLPFDLEIAGSPFDLYTVDIREFKGASFDNDILTLNFSPSLWDKGNASAVSKIEAGMPYLIRWLPSQEGTTKETALSGTIDNPTFNDVKIVNTTKPSISTYVTFTGTYEKLTWTADNTSILILGADNKLYYPKNGASLGAQRAYFELSGITAPTASGTRSIVLNFGGEDDETTSIMEVMSEGVKSEVSGVEGWFSLDGRKLNSRPTAKGIYIRGGKKVVIN